MCFLWRVAFNQSTITNMNQDLLDRLNDLEVPDEPEVRKLLAGWIGSNGALTLVVSHSDAGVVVCLCRFKLKPLDTESES